MRYTFRPVKQCNMCGSPERKLLGMRLSAHQGLRPRKAEGIAVPVKKCASCALIYSDPLPVPDRLEDHYSVGADEYWAAPISVDVPGYWAAEIAQARTLLGEQIAALDIGVGIGRAMIAMRNAGFDVWGIEPSAPFRDLALRNLPAERVIHAPIETADFPAGKFDFVTFGAVLEHLYDPSESLKRAVTWLRPGGVIHAEVPSSSYFIAKLLNAYLKLRGTNYVTHISPMHVPFHLYEFSLRSFEENGRRIGYEVAAHEFNVCNIMHIPRIFHWPLRRWMEWTDTGMQLTVYLRKSA